jgi:hypothetical protein
MATIQHGSRKAKVKINPDLSGYITEAASNNSAPQWNEQVTDENGNVVLDTFSDSNTATRSYDLIVEDSNQLADFGEDLNGSLLADDDGNVLGAITGINESTPAGRALKLSVSVTKFSSVDYSATS